MGPASSRRGGFFLSLLSRRRCGTSAAPIPAPGAAYGVICVHGDPATWRHGASTASSGSPTPWQSGTSGPSVRRPCHGNPGVVAAQIQRRSQQWCRFTGPGAVSARGCLGAVEVRLPIYLCSMCVEETFSCKCWSAKTLAAEKKQSRAGRSQA